MAFSEANPEINKEPVLYLSVVDDKFVLGRDILLGPHCVSGQAEIFDSWLNEEFVEAFSDEKSIESSVAELEKLAEHILIEQKNELNLYHRTNYSSLFWRMLVMPWLAELLSRAWISFVKLSKLRESYGKQKIRVQTIKEPFDIKFDDTGQFIASLHNDYKFNHWIDSEILTAIIPEKWIHLNDCPVVYPNFGPPIEKIDKNKGTKIRSIVRDLRYYFGYSDVQGTRLIGALLAALCIFLPKVFPLQKEYTDPSYRPEDHYPQEFLSIVNLFVARLKPASFLENFYYLKKYADRFPYITGRLRIGQINMWNDQEKIIAATAREEGERLVVYQHGGEYGILRSKMLTNIYELKGNIFFSWGWQYEKDLDTTVVPLPSPFHSRIKNKHKEKNNNVIIVGSGFRILVYKLHWWSKAEIPKKYFAELSRLLNQLKAEVTDEVIYRPYDRWSCNFGTREIVKTQFPKIRILDGDFHDELLKCRLVIFYSFGTALNHALAANVPSVIYIDPRRSTPRDEAKDYFDSLKKCGILHDNPEAAASHINSIWPDVGAWWNSSPVQLSKINWVNRFARSDKFWWFKWLQALWNLSTKK